jgi:hypothetical protein
VKLFIDRDSEDAVSAIGVPQAIQGFAMKRTNNARIDVQFFRSGQVVELPDGTQGQFELKPSGKYDAEPVTGAEGWSKIGTGTGTFYTFLFTLITDDLDALLHVNVSDSDDLPSINLMGEIQWTDLDGSIHATQTFTVTVLNNVIRPGDVIPGGGLPLDYMIDITDPMNPEFIIDEDSHQPVIAG